ncbi:SUMF1/EgtB/PvdO family nonheme iron enzyme [Verrucomicrobiota bacterium]
MGGNAYFSDWVTEGEDALSFYADGFYAHAAGDQVSWYQNVDLTGVERIAFDTAAWRWLGDGYRYLSSVQLLVDGTVKWERPTVGEWLNQTINVSGLVGMHELRVRLMVRVSHTAADHPGDDCGFDNLRALAAGTDRTTPTSTITAPSDHTVGAFTTASGTASDPRGAVAKVLVAVLDQSSRKYWLPDGNPPGWYTWQSGAWIPATGSNAWSFGLPSLTVGRCYSIFTRSVDAAGNTQPVATQCTFFYASGSDSAAPSSFVCHPPGGGSCSEIKEICGVTHEGSSGISRTEVSLRRTDTGQYWNGSTWGTSEVWLEAFGRYCGYLDEFSLNRNLPPWMNGVTYVARSRARDNWGNVEPPGSGNSFTFSGAAATYTISGHVRTPQGGGIVDVVVAATDQEATTDTNGFYQLANLPSGTYLLTPNRNGDTFTPISRSVSVGPNQANQDFTAGGADTTTTVTTTSTTTTRPPTTTTQTTSTCSTTTTTTSTTSTTGVTTTTTATTTTAIMDIAITDIAWIPGNTVIVAWTALDGVSYYLQGCTDLTAQSVMRWTNIGHEILGPVSQAMDRPQAPRAKLYRVVLSPIPTTTTTATTTATTATTTGSTTTTASEVPEGMVLIPGGSNSGTNPLGPGEEYDSCTYPETYALTVEAFYMDRTEVTKAQWDEVYTWAVNRPVEVRYGFDNAGSGKAADHPVHTISWYDCVKWCNARSEKEGRPVCYRVGGSVYRSGREDGVTCDMNVAGYRLPTEEEWEYATRGGVSSRRFPWGGNTISHGQANYWAYSWSDYDLSGGGFHPDYDDDPRPYTSPVGSFEAGRNTYGLYDMAGNVWEWCWDWDPCWEGSYRVNRGGGWYGDAFYCRVAYRYNDYPVSRNHNVGFRAVLPRGLTTTTTVPTSTTTATTVTTTSSTTTTASQAPEGMVYVAAGTAAGGSPTVSEGFYIDEYEVTNQKMVDVMQWAYGQNPALITASGSTVQNATGDEQELLDLDDSDCQISFSGGTFSVDGGKGSYPCVEVTWYGAAAYCNYLSLWEGRSAAYDLGDWTLDGGSSGYRLPSDAQWEYAARGGKDGNDTEYSGSDTIGDVAWYDGNSGGHSHEVGTKAQNELGTFDMSGNVWEWCHDWYPGSEGWYRVVRGGSWFRIADGCRVGYRGGNAYPGSTYNGRGFRAVLPQVSSELRQVCSFVPCPDGCRGRLEGEAERTQGRPRESE